MRPIAINLPQYHEMELNNHWWGKGFTEWSHVKEALPLFLGHAQPVHPLNSYYYDMTEVKTLFQQTEWMKQAGIYGMAYYHYWYEDRPLMQKPLELLLEHPEIDQKFMLYWSNCDWFYSKPNSYQRALMLHQEYGGPENWEKHIRYLLRFFSDPRYIQIDGKPVLCIYRPGELPHFNEMADFFRRICVEAGFNGLYIIETLFNYGEQPYHETSDAVIYREPNCCKKICGKQLMNGTCRDPKIFSTDIPQKVLAYQYEEAIRVSLREQKQLQPRKKHFHSVFTGWDNTPRHGYKGFVFLGGNPALFHQYVAGFSAHIEDSDDFLFINAWNEWAEGMYMEPTETFGKQYLEAIRNALSFPSTKQESADQENYYKRLLKQINSADTILLYGAGRYGAEMLQLVCRSDLNRGGPQTILFLDDTPEKQGTVWCDVPVVSLAEGLRLHPNGLIILCADERNHPLLLKNLNRLRIPQDQILIPEVAFWNPELDPAYLSGHETELSSVANLLADRLSLEVFHAVVRYRMYHDTRPLQKLADPIGQRYFDPAITAQIPEGIYFDCGSYNGDTLEAFLRATKGENRKSICCEPVSKNYKELCRTAERLDIKNAMLYEKAVWSQAGISMHFQEVSAISGVLSAEGSLKIETTTVDQIAGTEKVGFLKIEVNGTEFDALLGGTGVIGRDHPLIAVSVYHNTADLIRIPLLLKCLCPDYRLYLRYYGLKSLTDIVCYAVPPMENLK